MIVNHKGKKINIPVRKVSIFGKVSGLMFKNKETENLLFEFKNETNMKIHSFFVFFPFLAIWTNKENKVLDFGIVRPFRLSIRQRKSFQKLIEVPLNGKNQEIIQNFVDKKKDLKRNYSKS